MDSAALRILFHATKKILLRRPDDFFARQIPKLPHDKRGRPLIGKYVSGLIERDLFKRESELVAKFKDAPPTPKTKPEQKLEQKDKTAPPKPETKPEKTWLEKDEERVRKARREALERGELHDEDDDESFY